MSESKITVSNSLAEPVKLILRGPVNLSAIPCEACVNGAVQKSHILGIDPSHSPDKSVAAIFELDGFNVQLKKIISTDEYQTYAMVIDPDDLEKRRIPTLLKSGPALIKATAVAMLLLLLPIAVGAQPLTTTTERNPVTQQRTSVTQKRTYQGGDQRAITRDPNTARITAVKETRTWRDGSQSTRYRDPSTGQVLRTETTR